MKRFNLTVIAIVISACISVTVFSLPKRHLGTDTVTRATPVITSTHVGIHEGRVFTISGVAGGYATGTFLWITIATPATGSIHIKGFEVWQSEDDGLLYILEGPDSVSYATAVALIPINQNRQTGNESMVSVYNGVNVFSATEAIPIISASTATDSFMVTAWATDDIAIGDAIMVNGSTGNDDFYIVFDVVYATPTHFITVSLVPDGTKDGYIYRIGKLLSMSAYTGNTGGTVQLISSDSEKILKKDETYLIGIYNAVADSVSSVDIGAWIIWSEEGE